MKLTGAQIVRIREALTQAHCGPWNDPTFEPQRHRIEMLIDDIMEIAGLVRGDVAVTKGEHDGKRKQNRKSVRVL